MRHFLYLVIENTDEPSNKELTRVFYPALALGVLLTGCSNNPHNNPPSPDRLDTADATENSVSIGSIEPQIRHFCGGCHAVPRPESFPKTAWYDEVRRGFDFYYQSGRTDLKVPIQTEVATWFRERAPDDLSVEQIYETPSQIRFSASPIHNPLVNNAPFAIASIVTTAPTVMQSSLFCFSDMRLGIVTTIQGHNLLLGQGNTEAKTLTTGAKNPCVCRPCDLNGNGRTDYLICDLGSFLPEDHQLGRLIWLPDGEYSADSPNVILLDNIGRIADAHIADFDGDGDQDIVVAEFGWHKTGGIHVIWNDSSAASESQDYTSKIVGSKSKRYSEVKTFRAERIDSRHGAIHVPVTDLDQDGRLDFVALISQEHEAVIAFLNRPGGFEARTIYRAFDPSWGSSGIEIVDLDCDGDSDVLYTNGDTFDSYVIKPYHGIRWLENNGTFPFKERHIASLPGVHRALAADLDGDGDFDIAACSLIPKTVRNGRKMGDSAGVFWFEQGPQGRFSRHSLLPSRPVHAAMVATDVDMDSDIDIVVGGFYENESDAISLGVYFRNDGSLDVPVP